MRILFVFYLIVLFHRVQCQSGTSNEIATDRSNCQCDANMNKCDTLCCCDVDCSQIDRQLMNCQNEDMNSEKIQSKCFKNVPIYRSNSPYALQQQDDTVCIPHPKVDEVEIDSNLTINTDTRLINVNSSVFLPVGTPTSLSGYEVGSPVFRYIGTTAPIQFTYFLLPNRHLTSEACAGVQPITYMNDYEVSCRQVVNAANIADAFDATKYTSNFNLVQSTSDLTDTGGNAITCTGTSTSNAGTLLETLTMNIVYENPTGISSCTFTYTTVTANTNDVVTQRFSVRFHRTGASTTKTVRSGNPGYLRGSSVLAATSSGTALTSLQFTALQANQDGTCGNTARSSIVFGQNLQAICQINSATCPTTADLGTNFLGTTSTNIYIGTYGNSDVANFNTDQWKQVTTCTSEIGSSDVPVCQTGSVPTVTGTACYVRLDIQIAYANIGAVANPQSVIGAVVFHYRRLSVTATATVTSPILLTQTVTFQDLSNAPITQGDLLPNPNTKILGDFFYPFSLNCASNSSLFPFHFILLIFLALRHCLD